MKAMMTLYALALPVVLGLVGLGCNTSGAPLEPPTPKVVVLQSLGSQATAKVGDAFVSSHNTAAIHVLALDEMGEGIYSLASAGHTGDGSGIIAMPAGWTLETPQVALGGCVMKPTNIYNMGNGYYRVSVMSSSSSGPCEWRKGEYVYTLQIDTQGYEGGTIGKIVVK